MIKTTTTEQKKKEIPLNKFYLSIFLLGFIYVIVSNSSYLLVQRIFLNSLSITGFDLISIIVPWIIAIAIAIAVYITFKKFTISLPDDSSVLIYVGFFSIFLGTLVGYICFVYGVYPFIIITIYNLFFNGIRIAFPSLSFLTLILGNLYISFELFVIILVIVFYDVNKNYIRHHGQMFKYNNEIVLLSFVLVLLSSVLDFFNLFLISSFSGTALFSDLLYLIKILIIIMLIPYVAEKFPIKLVKKYLKLNFIISYLIITSISIIASPIIIIFFNQGQFYLEYLTNSFVQAFFLTFLLYVIILYPE